MALDKFQPYLFVSAGEQSNKYLTPVISPEGIASFQAQRAQELTGLTVRIDPIQEGTGDPSPTNIRPISGRTGMTVTAVGDNLYHIEDKTHTVNGITWKYSNGVVTGNGTVVNASSFTDNAFIYLPAGTYTIYDYANNTSGYVAVQDASNNISWRTLATTETNNPSTFTLTETTHCVTRCRLAVGTTVTNTVFKPMLMVGNIQAPTEFKPYTGTEVHITWESIAGTVYGGTLDVVSGVLTVDRAIYTGTWAKHPSYNTVFNTPEPSTYNYRSAQYTNCYCNCLPAQERGTTLASLNNTTQFRASDRLYVSVQNITTLADFRAWAEANELQLCYQLATPQTYRLTPTEVRTIAGFNQIYSDAGPVIDIKF